MSKPTYIRSRRPVPKKQEEGEQVVDQKVISDIGTLAGQYFQANKEKNAAGSKERTLRGRLLSACLEHGIKNLDTVYRAPDGADINLVITVAPGTKNVIDLAKLKSLLPPELYERCLSATQTQVESVAGKSIALAAKRQEATDINVSVGLKK